MNKMVAVVALVVVLAAVGGGAYFYLVHGSSNQSSGGSGQSSNNQQNGSSGSGTVSHTGAGTPLILSSQASSLFGTGSYNATSGVTLAELGENNLPSDLSSSVSQAWVMGDEVSSTQSPVVLQEVFQTSNPSGLYSFIYQNFTNSGSSLNLTTGNYNGLQYYYGDETSFLNATVLIGEQSNYVTYVFVLGEVVPASNLAADIYSDFS